MNGRISQVSSEKLLRYAPRPTHLWKFVKLFAHGTEVLSLT